MRVGDTIRRTTPWETVTREITDGNDLRIQEKMLREGAADFEVMTDEGFVAVPKIVVHQREIPEECQSCSA